MSQEVGLPSQSEAGAKGNFYKVPLELFRKGDKLEADLYMYYQGNHIIFRSKGNTWSDDDTRNLSNFGVSEVYVKFESPKQHHQFLNSRLTLMVEARDVPVRVKAQALYEVSDPLLSQIYVSPKSEEQIEAAFKYVKNCIKFLNDKGSLPELIELSSKSFSEHVHALHVSAYSIALAKIVGFQSYDSIQALGCGALLHDIGKSKIDQKILTKPAELTDPEWMEIRKHPAYGEEILKKHDFIPALARRVVVEHHERVNGKGYPHGKKDLHAFSKIVAITDVFNSLISERPFKKAMKPYEALKYMIVSMKEEFDPKLLGDFIEMLSK